MTPTCRRIGDKTKKRTAKRGFTTPDAPLFVAFGSCPPAKNEPIKIVYIKIIRLSI